MHAIKLKGEIKVRLHSFLTPELDAGGVWIACFHSKTLHMSI
jgi:hypothetical protein